MGSTQIKEVATEFFCNIVAGRTARLTPTTRIRLADAVRRFQADCDVIAEDDCEFKTSGLFEFLVSLLSVI